VNQDFEIIGEVKFPFLIVTPFNHKNNNLMDVKKHKDWKPISGNFNFIGHRGSGTTNTVGKKPYATENTMLSFEQAYKGGAPFVEFDVQLTKNKVAIIYHDFTIGLTLDDKNLIAMPIHELDFSNLENVKFIPRIHNKSFHDVIPKNCQTVQRIVNHHVKRSSFSDFLHATLESDYEERDPVPVNGFIPTFRELFESLPVDLGFDVEVKFPLHEEKISLGFDYFTDRNVFADEILKVIFDYSHQNRKIFMSCFDPDLCVILASKQATYPVLFLTEAGESIYRDTRCNSVENAIPFVKRSNLQGIISDSAPLLRNLDLVDKVISSKVPLMCYGSQMCQVENVRKLEEKGLVGICCDKVTTIIKNYKNGELKE
jgi:glycerophosphodiester phosphodiesterase